MHFVEDLPGRLQLQVVSLKHRLLLLCFSSCELLAVLHLQLDGESRSGLIHGIEKCS